MAERGGFEPPEVQNDDGTKDFDVIDISKLKAVIAETGVSREVPPFTHQVPQKPKRFAFQTEGEMEQKKVCANQERGDRSKVCQYCEHVRCEGCKPDVFPNLADGCCSCQARILARFRWRVD
jgi:hypothetical protein